MVTESPQMGDLAAQLTSDGGEWPLLRSGAYDLGAGVTSAGSATGGVAGWSAAGAAWGLFSGFSAAAVASPLENFLKDI